MRIKCIELTFHHTPRRRSQEIDLAAGDIYSGHDRETEEEVHIDGIDITRCNEDLKSLLDGKDQSVLFEETACYVLEQRVSDGLDQVIHSN